MKIAHLTVLMMCAGIFAPQAQGGAGCTCNANGQKYEQGQMLCIRGKLSRCTMNLNNPSWKVVADTCPEVRLPRAAPGLLALIRSGLPKSSLPSC